MTDAPSIPTHADEPSDADRSAARRRAPQDPEALLRIAAVSALRRIERDRQMMPPGKMRDVMDILLLRLFEPQLDVNALKEASGARDNNLSQQVRAWLGVGLHGYLEARRLDTAERLMRDTRLTLSAIAALVGYSHLSVFSRAFHRTRGVRPSTYRRQMHRARAAGARPVPPTFAVAPLPAASGRVVCAGCACRIDRGAPLHIWRELQPLCPLCAHEDAHVPRVLLRALRAVPGTIVVHRHAHAAAPAAERAPANALARLDPRERDDLVEALIESIDLAGGPSVEAWRRGEPRPSWDDPLAASDGAW
ncbi:MAG: AraC family transcriptional regulator [Acidobacteriota bacterium]